ncbi:MAG: M20 family metallopeptidase [Oscillospiraceae bacterium]|nr:M20 family metallopeptidase [Oscillospiraceae bacterium]
MFALECENLQSSLVNMRRELHQIPELGLDLPKTQAFVVSKLQEYGIEYSLNEGDSGIIAWINKGKPGKCIALRADMDALPIKEETGLPFASTNGCMHACGHDSHTSMLLGAAKVLKDHEEDLNGEVRLIFQTAEELSKGAQVMVKNRAMEGVDAVFGTHIGNIIDKNIPSGSLIVCPGPIMASFDRFIVKVHGAGCHGSTPEKGVDPINIAAHIIIALQEINAREFNACVPVVLTIGKIVGGSQYNIIPTDVVIEGTTRALEEESRQKLARRIGEISENIAKAFGGSAELEMDWGAPAVSNHNEMAAFAADCARQVLGAEAVVTSVPHPNMGGEDFAYYLKEAPGAFMFLSSVNPAKFPGSDTAHHNSRFTVDEDVFWKGSAVFVSLAENYLK